MRWPSPQLLAAQGPQGRCRNEGVEDTPHLIFCRPQGDHRKPVWVRGLRPPGIALTPESQCPADPRAGAVLPSSRSGLCTQISERRSQMCRCPSNSGSSAYRLFILEGCTAARGFRTELPTLRLPGPLFPLGLLPCGEKYRLVCVKVHIVLCLQGPGKAQKASGTGAQLQPGP